MKYEIETKKADDVVERIDSLERLLTERISDLHEIKGCMGERHSYMYYRKLLWEIKYELSQSLTEIKSKK